MQARARLYGMIDRHLDAVGARAEAEGLKRTPERREPKHFLWLGGYQVCGWSKTRIAEAIGLDRAAVVRAIENLAKGIGLTLRPANANDRSVTVEQIRARLLTTP
jgi:hypothetical protein